MGKHFVFDTNVLIHDPRAMEQFGKNEVVIPIYVLEEIDQFKKSPLNAAVMPVKSRASLIKCATKGQTLRKEPHLKTAAAFVWPLAAERFPAFLAKTRLLTT